MVGDVTCAGIQRPENQLGTGSLLLIGQAEVCPSLRDHGSPVLDLELERLVSSMRPRLDSPTFDDETNFTHLCVKKIEFEVELR
jgi:hypothetical protein